MEVIIGMDPHKRSAMIEVPDARERVREQGRYLTYTVGYKGMLAAGGNGLTDGGRSKVPMGSASTSRSGCSPTAMT
jgi:hypothetical protein